MLGLRVVLDTNVLVSGLAYPASIPGRIVGAWRQGAVQVVVSRYILNELGRVLPRLTHRLHWQESDFTDLLGLLAFVGELVEPHEMPSDAARDVEDVPVLGTLVDAQAEYLITGDQDLLVLADRYPIVTPAEFWRRHGG